MGKKAERRKFTMELKARKAGMILVGMGAAGVLITMWIGCGPRFSPEGRGGAWSSWKERHGFHARNFPEHVLKRVDERVQVLNLTQAQKEQYAAIRLKLKSELTAGQENRRRLMMDVKKEMEKELPDVHKVAATLSVHLETLPGAIDKFTSLFLEFYEILDEGQKAEVLRHFKTHLNRIPSHALLEPPGDSPDTVSPKKTSGDDISLSDKMARNRGDRHGELQ
jgi:hypothetical protein